MARRPPFTTPPGSPPGEDLRLPTAQLRWWIIGIIFLVIFLFFGNGLELFTDWLWFESVSLQQLFTTELTARIAVFLSVAVFFALVFLLNAQMARWQVKRNALFSEETLVAQQVVTYAVWGMVLFLGWMVGSAASANWLTILRYLNQISFGVTDPIFGLDVGFYIFTLPLLQFVQVWIIIVLFLSLFGAGGIYLLEQRNNLEEGRIIILPYVQLHLSILGALIFLTFAVGYWLDGFELMYSSRGVVFGASYTDINIMLPVLRILMVVAVITALVLIANIFIRRNVLPLAAIFIWLVGGVVLRGVVPQIIQRFIVEPNELTRETPYIEYNIELTNRAYGLEEIEARQFTNYRPLNVSDLETNTATLENIRLWDYRPLITTFQQLQALRLYYTFFDVDLDRYLIDGKLRQVTLSARELDKSQLQSPTWINQKLQFTHGYGVVMNPINQVSPDGLPIFWIKDLPPQSTVDLTISRPEIYFGENTGDYVFVNTLEEEFNFPGEGDEPVYTSYSGTGGIHLNNYFKRLAFALRLGDSNIILSGDITRDSRLLLYRDIQTRVTQIASFLEYDNDPYIVIGQDGRLYWILDAYTTSNLYPYSERVISQLFTRPINYIRNSIKVIIDPYNGDVTYYLVDETDPLAQTYRRIFPGFFKSAAEMPADLRAHWRYPEDLFRIQSTLYQTYHMQDAKVFYNQEDLWAIPQENFSGQTQPVEPYYIVASLPGETTDEFILIQPFTPHNKDNLIAWLAARADGENYGKLVVYTFPRQELVFGPLQIEARIDQEPEISAQFSLWDQGGSEVIRGNLLVLPLGDSLLYVEPIYLQAASGRIPELRRVIVASGEEVIMAETLAEGLAQLLGSLPTAVSDLDTFSNADTETVTAETAPVDTDLDSLEAINARSRELVITASQHYEAAQAALRQGDWAAYGEEIDQLGATLDELLKVLGPPEASR